MDGHHATQEPLECNIVILHSADMLTGLQRIAEHTLFLYFIHDWKKNIKIIKFVK